MKRVTAKILGMLLVAFFFAIPRGFGQNVIRVSRPYLLIDTDRKIGKIGDVVAVKRTVVDQIIDIGSVELLRMKSGKTIAKIIDETERHSVDIGDWISTAKEFDIDDLSDFERPVIPPSRTAERDRASARGDLDPFVILDNRDQPQP